MSVSYKFKCEICGSEISISNYGDETCPGCGRKYRYNEGHSLELTESDKELLRNNLGSRGSGWQLTTQSCVFEGPRDPIQFDLETPAEASKEMLLGLAALEEQPKILISINCKDRTIELLASVSNVTTICNYIGRATRATNVKAPNSETN